MRALLLFAGLALIAPGLAHAAPTTERCGWSIESAGKIEVRRDDRLHLLGTDGALPTPPADGKLVGVMCGRDSFVFDAHDDRVLSQLGVPLALTVDGAVLWLELDDGRYTVSFPQSATISDADLAALQARVNEFQERAQNAH